MPAYRSTTLKMVAQYCPTSLDFYDANTPYDRSVFLAGTAAHAVLEGFQNAQVSKGAALNEGERERVADAIATHLVTVGRSFDGIPEPPLPPLAASTGRDFAVRWWDREGYTTPLDWRAEKALAVDKDWKPVPYGSPTAYYKAILDLVGIVQVEDEYGGAGLCATDYKTAWGTGRDELQTVQLRGQVLVALAHAESLGLPQPDFLRRRVVNLRTRAVYEDDLYLSDDSADATLASWRKDIALAIAHAEARGPDGKRVAAPGAGCVGCPYVLVCQPAREYLSGAVGLTDPATIAAAYAVAQGQRDALNALAKEALGRTSIAVPGGVVGFVAKEERKVRKEAVDVVLMRWLGLDTSTALSEWKAENEGILGLVKTVLTGVAQVTKVAGKLYPGKGPTKVEGFKELREDLLGLTTDTVGVAKFGIWKDHEEPAENEPDGEE